MDAGSIFHPPTMKQELKEKYIRDTKAYIFITTDGIHMSNSQIDAFSKEWAARHGVLTYWTVCRKDSTTFYAYCKARDEKHFRRMGRKVGFKVPRHLGMLILY